jgi:hypothetical protein
LVLVLDHLDNLDYHGSALWAKDWNANKTATAWATKRVFEKGQTRCTRPRNKNKQGAQGQETKDEDKRQNDRLKDPANTEPNPTTSCAPEVMQYPKISPERSVQQTHYLSVTRSMITARHVPLI